ncbi:hypothetical protein CAC42_5579 [Sphaceloma murrayae]|uniref:Sec39 domain-containing protein n=1 Tax=Sphaceloma murrayae TaxID=2082308 RepID=A0A2K1QYN0_9PEZI|nr:hypothetical protein CAC42_5579 [Sphaceloma murrayae]
MAEKLSKAQCILLAVNFASESDIQALHNLYLVRTAQVLQPELVLRILLTYLPGVVPPAQYVPLIETLISADTSESHESPSIDVSSVNDISDSAANKRLKKLTLLPLSPRTWPDDAPSDILTRFICHRSYNIDQETGLITLLPDLVRPFLQASDYLQLWFISVVLPLLRLQHEYYPEDEQRSNLTLEAFEKLDGYHGTELLLSHATASTNEPEEGSDGAGTIGRDLKSMVGPWMYGHTSRKKRKLNGNTEGQHNEQTGNELAKETSEAAHSWEQVNTWLVVKARKRFPVVTTAIDDWDGPIDVDLGGFANSAQLLDRDERAYLEVRYAQAALASCYAIGENAPGAVQGAHGILVRLAELLDFEPPPDLATSVEQLPIVDTRMSTMNTHTLEVLEPETLLKPGHPLTEPTLAAYMLLQMLVYSAYQLINLGHSMSIRNVTKLRFFEDEDSQLQIVRKILHGLTQYGKRDERQWINDRMKLLWLWNWNIDPDEPAQRGSGPFGDIPKAALEQEILVAMLTTGNFYLVEKLYIRTDDRKHRMSDEDMEELILSEAMRCYDNASNGNRHRGNMKKADDIVSFFLRIFPDSLSFSRASALLEATHSISFYALTLQHNVPFQPVNIRASSDALSLLDLVLEQNPNAYTKLDDLISIGRNLAIASPSEPISSPPQWHTDLITKSTIAERAERSVIYRCISSALSLSDFDTAYSYLTARLQPSFSLPSDSTSENTSFETEDDISWRAAFLAGRTNPSPSQPQPLSSRIRRLEQRTELLSLSLLLAPPSALTEILNVYRRVEEEMAALLAQREREEEEHDAVLDRQRGKGPSELPGAFGGLGPLEGRVYGQGTRQVRTRGKMGKAGEEDEAPVGLFDLAYGAVGKLGRGAFPLRTRGTVVAGGGGGAMERQDGKEGTKEVEEGDEWGAWGEEGAEGGDDGEAWGWEGESGMGGVVGEDGGRASGERVRRRDMVANAVTGGLASGIGWVLGATPVNANEQGKERGG